MPSGSRSLRSEFALIRSLRTRFTASDPRIVRGIGEDTAVIKTSGREWTLLTTDLLVEGVHFDLAMSSLEDIGYRAAVANLSDIASMGGTPQYLLVAVAIPSALDNADIQRLYRGMMKACRPFHVRLIGGDTSASLQGLFLNLTLTGLVEAGRALRRDNARVGDSIYVTGTLGDSQAGLTLLGGGTGGARPASSPQHRANERFLVARHHRPSARVREGRWLVTHRMATAAIDLSDGLAGDIRHLCDQSKVGAELFLSELPISRPCIAFARARNFDPTTVALIGGEDYELLFTVPAGDRKRFESHAARARHRFTCIGVIRPHSFGLRIRTLDGALRLLTAKSYEHFSPRPGHRGSHS
jgi:thiamine-monophosphate kinase